MSTDAAKPKPPQANVSIESVLDIQQHNFWQRFTSSQAFWVTVALIIICVVMSWLQPASFATADNFYNTTRNFSFIGIMALGMTAVIATGGIDLSVGSIMGLTAVSCGLMLEAGYPAWAAVIVGLCAGGVVGPHQRHYHRLSRPFALRHDARHAGDRAVGRGGVVGKPHALQFRSRRTGVQGARQRRVAHHAEVRAELSAPVPHRLHVHSGRGLQDDELGSPRAGDRRQ